MTRFMISMPDEMLKKLDEAACKEHRSRSELLHEAARHRLAGEPAAPPAPNTHRPKAQKKSPGRQERAVWGNECCASVSVKAVARVWIGQSEPKIEKKSLG